MHKSVREIKVKGHPKNDVTSKVNHLSKSTTFKFVTDIMKYFDLCFDLQNPGSCGEGRISLFTEAYQFKLLVEGAVNRAEALEMNEI